MEKCKETKKEKVKKDQNGFVQTIAPKNDYTHIMAGDIVSFELKKQRNVKSKHKSAVNGKVTIEPKWHTCRVKTPTEKGFEVIIRGGRVSISTMNGVKFAYRSDGYEYRFVPV